MEELPDVIADNKAAMAAQLAGADKQEIARAIFSKDMLDILKSARSFEELSKLIYEFGEAAKGIKKKSSFAEFIKPAVAEAKKRLKQEQRQEQNSQLIQQRQQRNEYLPYWFADDKLDEIKYCESFGLGENSFSDLKYINGSFYSSAGQIDGELIRKRIADDISPYISRDVAKTVEKLFKCLQLRRCEQKPPIDESVIHFSNGTYRLDEGTFTEDKEFTLNRIAARYDPNAPKPEKWLTFLNDLLYPEDIPTLQEFMGYLLIPSNRGGAMLLIKGEGGEGKSCVGYIIAAMLGERNTSNTKIHKLEENEFALASLVGKLANIDDDVKMSALEQASTIKEIVTAMKDVTINPKHSQPYETRLYCRLLCFSNGDLSCLYDKSDGFFRRIIALETKPKPKNRKDSPFISEEIIKSELSGVLLWAMDGLHRLIENDFSFTKSERARQNIEQARLESNNVLAFLQDKDEVCYGESLSASSADLYSTYFMWCQNNALQEFKRNTFVKMLRELKNKFPITSSTHCVNHNGKEVRGFKGIGLKKEIYHGKNYSVE